jgi:hypothetical protein
MGSLSNWESLVIRFFPTSPTGVDKTERRRFRGDARWGGSIPGLGAVGTHVPCGGQEAVRARKEDRPDTSGRGPIERGWSEFESLIEGVRWWAVRSTFRPRKLSHPVPGGGWLARRRSGVVKICPVTKISLEPISRMCDNLL